MVKMDFSWEDAINCHPTRANLLHGVDLCPLESSLSIEILKRRGFEVATSPEDKSPAIEAFSIFLFYALGQFIFAVALQHQLQKLVIKVSATSAVATGTATATAIASTAADAVAATIAAAI